ncbi:hypothetical protein DU474_04520 [Campylobacter novaezeelandiae]|uniref:hypothetical protein n=1 Tax=Campylobacter novaezeelandiae TaxID=2267891 RepID=UPI0010373DB4|nr:hypothetical protein [Campylobacter novaezeelandiae]TBR79017.1 hypothetical protein DU474_04520 [Campylobacter novaezeelandiae]
MLFFGHKLIKTKFFFHVKETYFQNNAINYFFYNENLIEKAKKNNYEFAILAQKKDDFFLSNTLGAKYIICKDEKLAKFGAKAAEFYLFDSKILLLVDNFKNLDQVFKLKVDGVILKTLINFYSKEDNDLFRN